MVIDIFCHHIPSSLEKVLNKAGYFGKGRSFQYPPQNADAEVRLALMDKYGVRVQALSQTTPVLLGLNAEDAAEICRLSNNENYALCKAYPDRFVNICIVSLLDPKGAMNELFRAVNELDCRGITISTNQNGRGLDSSDYFPFYEKLEEYDLPVLLHPTNWDSYPLVDMAKGWRMMHIFGWPFDTTQAVWRLIFGGVLDRFPSLKIITHHLGAMLPYFSGRLEGSCKGPLRDKLSRPISEYWPNIYGDTAIEGSPEAYQCGYAFFGPDRMIFGTDYPFGSNAGENFIKTNIDGVKAMDIPEEDKEKILGGNAKKLLKIG